MITGAHAERYSVQHTRLIAQAEDFDGSFFRHAKWCPDGNGILAARDDHTLVLIPTHKLSNEDVLLPTIKRRQPAPLVECIWYPTATWGSDEGTFCYLTSVRDHPVKLIDGMTGKVRASYPIIDHRERFIAPHSMSFDPFTGRLYCGHTGAITAFDFHSPSSKAEHIKTTPSRHKKSGLKGIVSSISFSASVGSYFVGTLNGQIGCYDTRSGGELMGTLGGVEGAVTQVECNPSREWEVYAASRRQDTIRSWDVRSRKTVLAEYPRSGSRTNQRMRFDVGWGGHWLGTGDEAGKVALFDMTAELALETIPGMTFDAGRVTAGAVAFSPSRAEVVVVTGSRTYDDEGDMDAETCGGISLWSIIDRSAIPSASGEVAMS